MKKLYQMFKPLTLLLLIVILVLKERADFSIYSLLLLCAFIFSLIGDIFLMFNKPKFINGLIAFLIGHLFFTTSFVIESGKVLIVYLIPILISGLFLFNYFSKHVDVKLKKTVLVYIVIILIMLWSALNYYLVEPGMNSRLVFFGAVLFFISDLTLGINKFKKPFYLAEVIILGTYYTAQIMFYQSI
ncbi:MAG: lysoplasmalogenase [Melioribacteraceae bacterium]|nr:lysoplasmalogenase [Melioribacteraceae bacterium]MCF8355333.1 lysoplasmalogenase [Melioribacteraceae bacterium]MCF8392353.1 lysoplasmalogenase [Melioribacteraceae bacterium]MCF8417873.1 lysoplasmalogenase [Melioribacteraceae bacterium]